jgi:hypothetical protein
VPEPSAQPSTSCSGIRFQSAAEKLTEMIAKYGASSPNVQQWVQDEDQILADCSNPPSLYDGAPSPLPGLVPDPLTGGTPFERGQRDCQIAAANFYSGNFDTAAKMFTRIAAEPESPWRPWASYLVARALIRKATLSDASNDGATLAEAGAKLNDLIAVTRDDHVRQAGERLMGFVRAQLHPEKRGQKLAHAVMLSHSEGGVSTERQRLRLDARK